MKQRPKTVDFFWLYLNLGGDPPGISSYLPQNPFKTPQSLASPSDWFTLLKLVLKLIKIRPNAICLECVNPKIN